MVARKIPGLLPVNPEGGEVARAAAVSLYSSSLPLQME
jgi:hypothetical protein